MKFAPRRRRAFSDGEVFADQGDDAGEGDGDGEVFTDQGDDAGEGDGDGVAFEDASGGDGDSRNDLRKSSTRLTMLSSPPMNDANAVESFVVSPNCFNVSSADRSDKRLARSSVGVGVSFISIMH